MRFGMICLMMYLLATSLYSFRKKLKTLLLAQAYPTYFLLFPVSLCGTLAISKANDYSFLLIWFDAPRVCLLMEIKHYKNTIRIRIRGKFVLFYYVLYYFVLNVIFTR